VAYGGHVAPTRRIVLGGLGTLAVTALGCSRSEPAVRPTGAILTRWASDPWSLGSYSAVPIGASPTDRLRLGESFGPIHVAGEATSTEAPATVHGALASGERAAAEVAADIAAGGRVIVIGAGAAGLAAAARLAPTHSVTVLEARPRPYGRVHTDRSSGVPIELGAAWIHGADANPLVESARLAGVATVPFDWDDGRVVADDGARDDSRAREAFAATLEQLAEDVDLQELSVEQAVAESVARLGLDDDTTAAVDRLVASDIEGESALSATTLSVAGWNEGDDLVGGDLLVVGGFDRILEPLTAGIDLRTDAPVDRITWTGEGSGAQVDGPRFSERADAVILTVPLALLQAGRPLLDGPVPATWRDAADRLRTGTLDKTVLTFEPTVPDQRWPSTLVTGWWGADRGRFAEWINLDEATGAPVVVATTAGDAALELENADDELIIAEATEVFDRISVPM
jgi:monoamine oxidase